MKRERSRHIESCCDGDALSFAAAFAARVRMSTSAAAGRRERKADAYAMMSSMRRETEDVSFKTARIRWSSAMRREGEKGTRSNRASFNQIGRYDEEFDDDGRRRDDQFDALGEKRKRFQFKTLRTRCRWSRDVSRMMRIEVGSIDEF